METSNLYFIHFPKMSALKIGKADDIEGRYNNLKKYWGEADLTNSYYVNMPSREVYKYEKSLHLLYSKYSISLPEGDGKTEFFDIQVLDKIISYFLSCTDFELKKDIKLKSKEFLNKKSKFKRNKLKQSSNTVFLSISEMNIRLNKLSKLLNFLIKFKNKLFFQYDLIDGEYYFRVKLDSNIDEINFNKLIDKIWNLLSFKNNTHSGWGWFTISTWCTRCFSERTFQIVITDPMSLDNDHFCKIFFEGWSALVYPVLQKLPNKLNVLNHNLAITTWSIN
ncbi:GIY-YIG nuclease family protein [Acinetobacter baumannii]|nr:GIY-YIG nuclease family protein [Acinetobacter baumannii]